jgi:phenylalanyl-tRNA synthetase alpha chain
VPYLKGSLHPSLRVIDEVVDFFVGLGYRVAEGPEVETDYYNFTALNIPPGIRRVVCRILSSSTRVSSCDAHFAGPDPDDALPGTAGLRGLPGAYLPARFGPDAHPDVQPDRGSGGGQGLNLGHLKGTLAAMADTPSART